MFLLLFCFLQFSWGLKIIPRSADCGPVIEYTEPEGVITSPFYPNRYPNNTSCKWIILTSNNVNVSIHLVDVDIEPDHEKTCFSPPCCIRNGISISVDNMRNGLRRRCGYNSTFTSMMLSQRVTYIDFHTTMNYGFHRGFKLEFRTSQSKCTDNQFRCDDFFCIDEQQHCDGQQQCKDGSDEVKCVTLTGYYCPPPLVPCGSPSPHCFDNYTQRCDGVLNCENAKDEMGCGHCKSTEIPCRTGHRCYSMYQSCDGNWDCPFGEDEIGCATECGKHLSCDHGGCYSVLQRCDGSADCTDGSDEVGCLEPHILPPCPRGPRCGNGGPCLEAERWCDGTADCPDGSDETSCGGSSLQNSVIAAAIMGSLVCGLLLVLAVGCTCRLYSLRMATISQYRLHQDAISQFANTSTLHHPMSMVGGASHLPAPLEEEFWHREPPPAYSVAVGLPTVVTSHVDSTPRSNRLFTIAQSTEVRPIRATRHSRSARHTSIGGGSATCGGAGSSSRRSSLQSTPTSTSSASSISRPRPRPRPGSGGSRHSNFVCPTTSATAMVPLGLASTHRSNHNKKRNVEKQHSHSGHNQSQRRPAKSTSDIEDFSQVLEGNENVESDSVINSIEMNIPSSALNRRPIRTRNLELDSNCCNQSSSEVQSDMSPSRTSTTSLASIASLTHDEACAASVSVDNA
ncbi:low-density lipoprotein receptor-related protein 12-like [Ctenocephalides felis]|uniref:low-density lipoprotein receptor-related protein 12-like n=1 Tax=Ctenocephalides felis TaxID=7515 RepID=UPI000E6E321A|nr:low-density lipoprotein receptor-related protein 12-like [Ctenocephalides felis]